MVKVQLLPPVSRMALLAFRETFLVGVGMTSFAARGKAMIGKSTLTCLFLRLQVAFFTFCFFMTAIKRKNSLLVIKIIAVEKN